MTARQPTPSAQLSGFLSRFPPRSYLAIGPVYGARGALRVAKSAFLAFAVGAIVLGYRFVIFVITLYTT